MEIDRAKQTGGMVPASHVPVGACFTFDPSDLGAGIWMRFKRAKRTEADYGWRPGADAPCIPAVSLSNGREDAFTTTRLVVPVDVIAQVQ